MTITKGASSVARKNLRANPHSGGRVAVRLEAEASQPIDPKSLPTRSGKRRRSSRSEDVRARILVAALECFGAFGFEGTSTRAVAERADVTHTLILYHFKSKDQLWIAMMDLFLGQYMTEMRSHLDRAEQKSAASAVRTFIEQFVRMSAERPQIHRILTMESNQGTPRLDWVINQYLTEHYEMVTTYIRSAQQEGEVRQCDPARLYYMIIGAGGTLFNVSTEYKALTGRDVFSETEILRNIAFLYELIFIDAP